MWRVDCCVWWVLCGFFLLLCVVLFFVLFCFFPSPLYVWTPFETNWVSWHIIWCGSSALHILKIQHAICVKGCPLGICYTCKSRCLIPPNSHLVIFNIPFFELVAPMHLIYLCQENVFLLRCLLSEFEVHRNLYPPFGYSCTLLSALPGGAELETFQVLMQARGAQIICRVFSILLSKPTLCNSDLPANTVIQASC